MVLGLLLREDEERALSFDFEMLLPDEAIDRDDSGYGSRKDFKRGTVVCRHWLRALCMKGDNCEFLHQYDMSKMPECRWGMECQVPECPFRHVPDEERVECAFYRQGFCSHGASCRYRHLKLAREDLPERADFTLQAQVADEEHVKRRKAHHNHQQQTPTNDFFKVSICKHWEKLGHCPFGDECHFAHGDRELRPFPEGENDLNDSARGNDPRSASRGPLAMQQQLQHANNAPGPQLPQLPDANKRCTYFLCPSQSYHNVAHSVHFRKWSLPHAAAQAIGAAKTTSDDVFLIVTVLPSRHFQGVVRVSQIEGTDDDAAGEDLAAHNVPFASADKSRTQWRGAFSVDWLRICECPWERLEQFEHKQLNVIESPNGLELDTDTGHALVRLLFNQPPIKLSYKSVEDEQHVVGGAEALATRRRQAAESLLRDIGQGPGPAGPIGFSGPMMQPPPLQPQRWTPTLPGFIISCTTPSLDECFGRMLFGLAQDQETLATQHIQPGTPLFLLNKTDMHVLGVFEALTPPVLNMVPGAFGPNGPQQSHLPLHVRFAVVLHAPALSSADPQVQQLGSNVIQSGPLSLPLTQRLADVFAERCNGGPPMGFAPQGGTNNGPLLSGPNGSTATTATGSSQQQTFVEKLPVGIENDSEFNVTRRLIGHAGSHIKRIMADAGGNAKVRVRGRGSGSKEIGADELNEPLTVLITADNDRSLRIACELVSELLGNVHRDYRHFMMQRGGGGGGGGRGGGGGPFHGGGNGHFPPHHQPPFRGPPPSGGFPPMNRGGGGN